MKKLLIIALAIVVIAGTAVGAYLRTLKPLEPEVSTAAVDRGDIVQTVGATGTLEAVRTVDVATQVSGVVKEMYADFNSIVKAGQLVAKIDPATIEAQLQQDDAQMQSAEANLERQRVTLNDSKTKLKRAEDLFNRHLVTLQDYEAAQVAVKTNEAQIKAQNASITQIKATRQQHLVNLGYTDIYAPIDGIVINRKVDVGQTVVSNNMATSLYQIAQDMTKMQLKANIDESDVGLLRPGQDATFRVDAFPGEEFRGTVAQIRLQPVVSQNVVMYTTIIHVPNGDLRLKPGMTANVSVEIARRENVLRVPVAALRFRATSEIFQALGLTPPTDLQQRNRIQQATTTVNQASEPAVQPAGGPRPAEPVAARQASTIDALFSDLVFEPISGRVWVHAAGPEVKPRPLTTITLRTGINDGTYAEVLDGLNEGQVVVTSVNLRNQNTAGPGGNPLMPGRQMMRFGGGDHGPH